MEVIVRKAFRMRAPDGKEKVLCPGERVHVENSETVQKMFDGGYIELPMTEGQRRSLEMCMDATMFQTMKEIQAGGKWRMPPEVKQIEQEIHETYEAVLKGLKKLSDYRAQIERWQKAGTVH